MQRTISTVSAILLSVGLLAGCSRIPPEQAIAVGQKALAEGDYETAVLNLRAAARANPQNEVAFYNLGMAQMLAGQLKAAESSFVKAADLGRSGEGTDALVGLAEARRRQGKFDLAAAAYEQAFSKADRKPRLLAGSAAIEMDRGNYGAAKLKLDEALAADPMDPVVQFNYAVLCSRKDSEFFDLTASARSFAAFATQLCKPEFADMQGEAVRRLHSLASLRPPEIEATVDNLMVGGKIANVKEAFRLDQSNPDILARLIKLLRKNGENGTADKLAEHFRVLFPDDARVGNL